LSPTQSKAVLHELAARGGDPAALAKEMGFEALAADSLAAVVAEVVAAHPDEWQRYLEGDEKVSGVFVGAVMKATKGQADGAKVAAELRRLRG
jgi:Asp-tRNA(Asn)/Glu-tRNA(Gln) amidotransferase B subunit